MDVLRLDGAALDRAVDRYPLLVIECSDDPEGFAARVRASGVEDAAWGHVDARGPDDALARLGVAEPPATLVFRERVILWRQPRRPDAAALAMLVRRVRALDMGRVRAEIDEARAAEAALFMRRVCPATRRRG